MISRALISAPWLLALGALVIGLTLGRYLVPASPTSGEIASSSPEFRPDTSSGRTSSSFRDTPSSRSRRQRRKTSLQPAATAETHLTLVSEILNRGSRIERTRDMLALIDRLDQDELEAMVDGFGQKGWIDYNRGEFSLLLAAWVDRAPFAALNYLSENKTDGWIRKTAIAEWATRDPSAAASAIAGLEDDGEVNDWMVGLVQGMARNDPDQALVLIDGLPGGETRTQALREIVPEVVVRGTDFAARWIEQIPDAGLRLDAAKQLAGSMARRNPETASEWITTMPDPEMRREASEIVSEIYAREDLDGAMAWVTGLPEESVGVAAQNVARHLTRKDPGEAAVWLRNLGDAPSLDAARIRFLQEAGRQDPVTALESVPTLSRPKDQERYYRDILNRWRKEDKEAALAWATSHSESIPPKVLLSILPRDTRRN